MNFRNWPGKVLPEATQPDLPGRQDGQIPGIAGVVAGYFGYRTPTGAVGRSGLVKSGALDRGGRGVAGLVASDSRLGSQDGVQPEVRTN